VLRTRAPLSWKASSPIPSDLHVLGLPLAFILSQDQTLHCIMFCLITDPIYSIESSYNLYLRSTIAGFPRLYLYTVLRLVYLVFKKHFSTSFAFAHSVSLRLIIIYSPSKELSLLASRFGTFFIFVIALAITFSIFQTRNRFWLFSLFVLGLQR
jgi:hypothetical protein